MDTATLLMFILGLGLLIGGAEALVRGASRLASAAGISPLVIGLTVVAFGTGSPELAVSLHSALAGQADIALGNVIGSNIANVLLILGLSAAIAPLIVSQQLVRLDVPIMIGVSLLLAAAAADGRLNRLEGLLLFAGIVAYTFFAIRQSQRETMAVANEYSQEFCAGCPPTARYLLPQLGLVVIGLALLILGARWLVNGAVTLARALGLSELVIGLTIVAVGTSLPEIATSIIAAMRGERDIAVGNVVGSNIFNILGVLGLTALIAPNGVAASPVAQRFDIPIMIVVALACLPIFFTDYKIARWEGWLFLAYYAAYTLYLFLKATQNSALRWFSVGLFGFAVPLTAITLAVLAVRALRARQSEQG